MNTTQGIRAVQAIVTVCGLLAGWNLQAATFPTARIADLDPRQVRFCRPAGTVTGMYDWHNDDSPGPTQKAKEQARARAAARGATNILWTQMTSSYSSAGMGHAEVTGQAYICQRPLPLP